MFALDTEIDVNTIRLLSMRYTFGDDNEDTFINHSPTSRFKCNRLITPSRLIEWVISWKDCWDKMVTKLRECGRSTKMKHFFPIFKPQSEAVERKRDSNRLKFGSNETLFGLDFRFSPITYSHWWRSLLLLATPHPPNSRQRIDTCYRNSQSKALIWYIHYDLSQSNVLYSTHCKCL